MAISKALSAKATSSIASSRRALSCFSFALRISVEDEVTETNESSMVISPAGAATNSKVLFVFMVAVVTWEMVEGSTDPVLLGTLIS